MPRLLVVDDRPLDAAVAVRLLRDEPEWDVEQFSEGEDALASIKDLPCDLVLTDLHMPGMCGLELMKQIHRRRKGVPVVVMTSRGDENKAVTALQSGAASYLPKSLLEAELVPTCRRVLDSSRLHRDQAALMDHLVEERFEIHLDNNRLHVPALVNLIVERCLQFQLCEPARAPRIGVAVEEALLNAIIHGNLEVSSELREDGFEPYEKLVHERLADPHYGDRRVTVRTHLTRDDCRITIRDEGPGFRLEELRDPTDPENVARVSGRGILLMRSFLDEVIFGDRGNEVQLVVQRNEGLPNPLADLRVSRSIAAVG